jgi:hypothetical protein
MMRREGMAVDENDTPESCEGVLASGSVASGTLKIR